MRNNLEKNGNGLNIDFSSTESKSFGEYKKEMLRKEFDLQLKDSKEIRENFKKIADLCGVSYANSNEEGFSGDGASLFILVKFERGGEEKSELVKIGWGEFSKQTFTKGEKSKYSDYIPEYKQGKDYHYKAQHEVMRSLPFDVYCVNQHDSYFADNDIQNDMCFKPEKYLREHAMFVTRNGEVTMATKNDLIDSELNYDIAPISEKDALSSIEQAQKLYTNAIDRLSQQE